jgi:hypothetical protein
MADVIDVQNALVALIAQTLYPNGTSQPSIVAAPCKVYPGWPTQSQLDADLIAGTHHVTVYPSPTERNTTRYPKRWKTLAITAPTLTLAVNGQQITVGGAMPAPFSACNMAILVSGKNYVYAVQSTDSLASIATALAALLAADYPGASSLGAVITVPTVGYIASAKVGTTGTSIREIRRQEKVFQITAWCDTPAHRDAVVGPVDVALAATQFLTLADGTAARLIYKSTLVDDAKQKAKLYRRDLIYTVEYATTQTATDTQIVASQSNFSDQPTGATAPVSTFTINH